MKATVKTELEVEIKFLKVSAGVRYWEDATVNGVEDETGSLIPCKNGVCWEPLIDVNTGEIINWTDVKADIHYKVCDAGNYYLLDENKNVISSIINDYVPDCLCPNDNGYGDYIIMKVNESGIIEHWTFTQEHVDDFETHSVQ